MALKDTWKDRIDGEDDILASDINLVANEVIRVGDEAEISKDYTESLSYYGVPNIKPTDESLFLFTLDDETMTAYIDPHPDHYGEISGDLVIPHHYTEGDKTYTVTSIGCFNYCADIITSVTLPNTITEIGGEAFSCMGSIATVKIPDSVEVIDWDAFMLCISLTEITLPKNLKIIGDSAFSVTGLKEIVIPDGVTAIGTYAFSETGLKEIVIPDGVTTIGEGAFSYCEFLESVVIPESVTYIGDWIFERGAQNVWTTVYYNGTEEQWNAIEKSDEVFGYDQVQVVFLGAATKKYVDEKLEGKADKSTKINGKSLSEDINLTASDVGALPSDKIVGGFGVPFDVSGTNLVTIDKVHPKEHDVEVKVESINLLNDTDFKSSMTVQWMTIEYEGNGIFHIYGTSNGVIVSPIFPFEKEIDPNESYTLYVTLLDGTLSNKFYPYIGVYNGVQKRNYIDVSITPNSSVGTTYSKSAKPSAYSSDATHIKDLWLYTAFTTGDTIDCRIQVWLEKGVAKNEPCYVPFDIGVESVTACGKNLIPFPYTQTSKTENGVTFTVNDDGSILVNGTATKNTQFHMLASGFEIPKTGNYHYSGCPSGGNSTDTYFLLASKLDSNGWVAEKYDTGNGVTWLYEEGYTYKFSIYIFKDTVCENLLFKPMLEVGSVATEYEIYKGATYPVTDGKAIVKSVSPTMNIATSANGVNVEAKGYQDGLAIIDELKQAILSLGGNI